MLLYTETSLLDLNKFHICVCFGRLAKKTPFSQTLQLRLYSVSDELPSRKSFQSLL